ncbi:MAG: hypothetical protein JRL30_28195 [Deltaproteobacteria bacterium]|nr:hypothetical protein [Deltaproteobacteria bacterium]
MENKRCINHLHWVFDLPDSAGLSSEEETPTRVMMIYDRATDIMKIEILDKGLPAHVREHISSWLHKNSHLRDGLNGLD